MDDDDGDFDIDDMSLTRSDSTDEEINATVALLETEGLKLQELLSLSWLERLQWKFGRRLPTNMLAKRIFGALKLGTADLLHPEQAEAVLNYLSQYFPMGKATADMIRVRLSGKDYTKGMPTV